MRGRLLREKTVCTFVKVDLVCPRSFALRTALWNTSVAKISTASERDIKKDETAAISTFRKRKIQKQVNCDTVKAKDESTKMGIEEVYTREFVQLQYDMVALRTLLQFEELHS